MTLAKRIEVTWIDSGREPKCAPNPAHPKGMDLDLSGNAKASCIVDLPYPAKRCGIYMVSCNACGLAVAITTAGRSDDPKSARLGCLLAANSKIRVKRPKADEVSAPADQSPDTKNQSLP